MNAEIIKEQIKMAQFNCERRISNGTEINSAFEWLFEETSEIFSGKIHYPMEYEAKIDSDRVVLITEEEIEAYKELGYAINKI